MARSHPQSSAPHLVVWAILCLTLGTVLAVAQVRLYCETRETAFLAAESDAAAAEQALLRAFDLAAEMHDLLRIKHGLLDYAYSTAGIALDQHLRSVARNGRFGLVQVSVVGADGHILWSSWPDAVGVSVADRSHVRVPLDDPDGGTFVSAPVIGRTSGRWSIQVSQPIRDARSGAAVAVSVVALDPVQLSRSLQLAAGEGRRVAVRRLSDGAILARSEDVEAHLPRPADAAHPIVVAGRTAVTGREEFASRRTGTPVLAAHRVPDGIPVAVSAIFDRSVEMRGFWLWCVISVLAFIALAVAGLRIALGIARRQESQRILRERAELDPLTGLLNRRAMESYAHAVFEEARRTAEPVSILLLDVDHFKSINDGFGHDAGDRVLRDLAALVRQAVRSGDQVCRWGGEEILVVLRNCDGPTALARGEELRTAVAAMYAGGAGPVPGVTVSIGAAVHPRTGAGLGDLVLAADVQLYMAKRSGRNRVLLAPEFDLAAAA